MKLVDAIANAVASEGISVAFNLPDEVTIHIVQALSECGIRIVRARHEQNAIAMADGFARAGGGPAVCSIGPGPALAQTGNGLVTAQRHGTPILVLLGGTKGGLVKEFDARGFVENTGARYFELTGPMTPAEDIRRAFIAMRGSPGPVVLAVPHSGALSVEISGTWSYSPTRREPLRPAEIDPGSPVIEDAAGMLASARRPVVLAGRGAVLAGAKQEIEDLGERLGAPIGTSLQGYGYFRGHRLNIGVIGGFATEAADRVLADADVVLAVGFAINYYQLLGRFPRNARVIQIDTDAAHIGLLTRVDLPIVADARAAVRAINRALQAADISRSQPWTKDLHGDDAARPGTASPAPVDPDKLSVTQVLPDLERLLPADRVLVVDGGRYLPFVLDMLSVPDPDSWIWSLDFGSIGLGLPMAIGAKTARPDQHCVLITGDGGFMMSIQELETAVRERVPLTIIVFNNSAYAAEVYFLRERGKPLDLALYDDVDFAAVARAFGAQAATVRSVDDLARCAALLAGSSGPVVIDVKVGEEPLHHSFPSH